MDEIKSNKPVIIWLLSGCLLILTMVVIGGITRLTHSGLSMVEWHLFMGSIPPLNEFEWQSTFDSYKNFPEYQQVNFKFSLQDFKSIFWWEYIHRMIGRLLGIVFIVPFMVFYIQKRLDKKTINNSLILFALGAFQGFLGWFMVKSGLIKEPSVSHFRLAAHLITAFLTCAFTLWVALDLVFANFTSRFQQPKLYRLSKWFFGFVVVQVIYGAFVAGTRAGTIHTTFPKMGDQWIASDVVAHSPIWMNFLSGLAGVQFVHRYMAYAVAILSIAIWWKSMKVNVDLMQSTVVRAVLYMVVLQFLLGVFTLLNAVPITLGIAHQLGAFLLLMLATLQMHRLRPDH